MNIEKRMKAEKAIIKALAKECFSLGGHSATVIYVSYERNLAESTVCTNPTQVYNAVSECDESHIYVVNQFTGKTLAVFFIVLGNDGYDCIADMTNNAFTNKVELAIEPLIDQWEVKLIG